MMIGAYQAGLEMGIRMVHTDLVKGCITDIETDEKLTDIATLTLENFIDAKGACLWGNPISRRNRNAMMPSTIWHGFCSVICGIGR